MASKAYLDHLRGIPLFADCSVKELELLARSCDEINVKSGKTLMKQGAAGFECFIIVKGEVSVDVGGRIVTTLGPGAYFGELALLDRQPRSATVTALTDLDVLVMGPREFANAVDNVPGLAQKLLRSLARRVRETDAKFVGH